MLKIYTNTPDNFKYIDQYKEVLQQIITDKTDLLWKNYVNFNFAEQSALSVGLEGDEVKVKVIGFDRGKVKLSIKQAAV